MIAFALLQASGDPFLPNTLLEWMALLAYGVAVGGFALGIMRQLWIQPLKEMLAAETKARGEALVDEAKARKADHDGLGARIAYIATESTKSIGRVEIMERHQDGVSRDCSGLHEAVGELKAQVQMLAQMHHQNEVARATDLGKIGNQIAAIETELRLMREARGQRDREG